ncbi:hypothetical protein Bpfe_014474, partial [Biomphalaria pfeifferi]
IQSTSKGTIAHLNLGAIVDQASHANPPPRAIVNYQAYNSDLTPAESQACVPNTGEKNPYKKLTGDLASSHNSSKH